MTDVTRLLGDARNGDDAARAELFNCVYAELRDAAARLMRQERADHTLQPTALVNEALARLLKSDALVDVDNRAYFFGMSARVMRQVLVDHARKRNAEKRGADHQRVPLDEYLDSFAAQNLDVLDLDKALEELRALNQRQCQVVELRFFGGLTMPQIAEVLEVSIGTVESDWRVARAFLETRLGRMRA